MPKPDEIAADERGSLEAGSPSVEERAALFRDALAPLLKQGHKWDAILLGLADQLVEDRRNFDYGRLLGITGEYQTAYRMAEAVLRGLSPEMIVLDRRHRAGEEKAEEPTEDEEVVALIKMASSSTDHWGEDLFCYVLHRLDPDDRYERERIPPEYMSALERFSKLGHRRAEALVRRVLEIPEGTDEHTL